MFIKEFHIQREIIKNKTIADLITLGSCADITKVKADKLLQDLEMVALMPLTLTLLTKEISSLNFLNMATSENSLASLFVINLKLLSLSARNSCLAVLVVTIHKIMYYFSCIYCNPFYC